jgi:hypothetical protein
MARAASDIGDQAQRGRGSGSSLASLMPSDGLHVARDGSNPVVDGGIRVR